MPLSLLMTDGACGGSAEEGGNQLAQTAGSPNEHHQRPVAGKGAAGQAYRSSSRGSRTSMHGVTSVSSSGTKMSRMPQPA